MSTEPRALPPGWSMVLDEVQARLDHAIASASARIDQVPHSNSESLAQERRQEIAQWSDRLRRLSTYLESAEQAVQSVDEMLHKEETHLRQQMAACETLRQKAG